MMTTFLLTSLVLAQTDFPTPNNTEKKTDVPLMSAPDAARGLQVPPGVSVTVFAAEPDVQNPIAVNWDRKGRLWVAENYTYAERPTRFDLKLRDRIIVLEDTNQDGVADQRKVFTDQLQMLTSVEVGKGGVWAMCPPQLLFIPDANEDCVPDGPPIVVLDGFTVAESNYHNFANGLRFGPDGWLYGRCGHSCPGNIGLPGTPPEQRYPIYGGIWRYHPKRKTVEVLVQGTTNPWGHDWDQHGELFFINTVNGHLWHCMPGAHFKESFGVSRNPGVFERMDTIADHYHFDVKGGWQASRDGKANDLGGGHAHIGMMIYQANQWPAYYRNKLYTLNMHGRRTNVEKLERSGSGYVGKHEPDLFLAKDPWFRGMELTTGPDGNIYLVDWSDTGECHEQSGVHRTSGRIFKLSYGKPSSQMQFKRPWCMNHSTPLAQLWQDYQDEKVTEEQLLQLLTNPDEHLRAWAIRLLADTWPLDRLSGPLPGVSYPAKDHVLQAMIELAKTDQSSLVHLTLATTMQRMPIAARSKLASALFTHEEYASDAFLPYLVWYGLMAVGDQQPETLAELLPQCQWPQTVRWMIRKLTTQIEQKPEAFSAAIKATLQLQMKLKQEVLNGIAEGLQGYVKLPKPTCWDQFISLPEIANDPRLISLNAVFGTGLSIAQIEALVRDKKKDHGARVAAWNSLVAAKPMSLRSIGETLLGEREMCVVAARGLAGFDDPKIAQAILNRYRLVSANERGKLLDVLCSRTTFAKILLQNIGSAPNQVPVSDLSAAQARQIASFHDKDLQQLLMAKWGTLQESTAARQQQIAELKSKLTKKVLAEANLSNGKALFVKNCAACHKMYGEGGAIGPDITGSQRDNMDYLLGNIIDPSSEVPAQYLNTIVEMTDGRQLGGIVVRESPQVVVLQLPNEQVTLNRQDIQAMKRSNKSFMPEDLLQPLRFEEVVDLIGYLMNKDPLKVPK
ncbi:MAG: c-type cytochrome [Zavarzinella sp.]